MLAFASTIGLLPFAIMTLIGIVLLPLVLLYVFIACSLAYLAGVYFIGARIWQAIRPISSNLQRIFVLAVSLVLGGLLTMVPLLGWPVTLLLVAFGFGVVAARFIARWGQGEAAQLAARPAGESATGMQTAL